MDGTVIIKAGKKTIKVKYKWSVEFNSKESVQKFASLIDELIFGGNSQKEELSACEGPVQELEECQDDEGDDDDDDQSFWEGEVT